jgi:hypothetical protein
MSSNIGEETQILPSHDDLSTLGEGSERKFVIDPLPLVAELE